MGKKQLHGGLSFIGNCIKFYYTFSGGACQSFEARKSGKTISDQASGVSRKPDDG
jgi:hypothetical protein